jgi:hypothetical protein
MRSAASAAARCRVRRGVARALETERGTMQNATGFKFVDIELTRTDAATPASGGTVKGTRVLSSLLRVLLGCRPQRNAAGLFLGLSIESAIVAAAC